MPTDPALETYIATLARLARDRPDDDAQHARIAVALPSLLALAARLGPWPAEPPAGALDRSD